MKTFLVWLYYAVCSLGAFVFFWLPVFWPAPPIGLTTVVLLCLLKAWTFPYQKSIKPLPGRELVDGWSGPRWLRWLLNLLLGNPEDGVTGVDAYGPSWSGSYNPLGTRWKAIQWNCRNWMAGFNYITWRPGWGAPPLIIRPYTVFGRERQLKIGWQQRYGKTVMVCSA